MLSACVRACVSARASLGPCGKGPPGREGRSTDQRQQTREPLNLLTYRFASAVHKIKTAQIAATRAARKKDPHLYCAFKMTRDSFGMTGSPACLQNTSSHSNFQLKHFTFFFFLLVFFSFFSFLYPVCIQTINRLLLRRAFL